MRNDILKRLLLTKEQKMPSLYKHYYVSLQTTYNRTIMKRTKKTLLSVLMLLITTGASAFPASSLANDKHLF